MVVFEVDVCVDCMMVMVELRLQKSVSAWALLNVV